MRRLARLKPAHRPHRGGAARRDRAARRRGAGGRPGPDVRLPGAVPGDLRAARACPVEERETFRSLACARFDVTGGGIGAFGAVAGRAQFLFDETARQRARPGRRADRPDHPRARRRDQRLRPRPGSPTASSPAGSRPAPACSRSARPCCSSTRDALTAWSPTTPSVGDRSSRSCCATSPSCRSRSRGSPSRTWRSAVNASATATSCMCHLPAANRDPRVGARTTRFDPDRATPLAPRLRPRLPPLRRRRAGADGAARARSRPWPGASPTWSWPRRQRAGFRRAVHRLRRGVAAGLPRQPPTSTELSVSRAERG